MYIGNFFSILFLCCWKPGPKFVSVTSCIKENILTNVTGYFFGINWAVRPFNLRRNRHFCMHIYKRFISVYIVDLNMCKRSLIFYSSITFLTKEFHIYSEQNYQYPFGWRGGWMGLWLKTFLMPSNWRVNSLYWNVKNK